MGRQEERPRPPLGAALCVWSGANDADESMAERIIVVQTWLEAVAPSHCHVHLQIVGRSAAGVRAVARLVVRARGIVDLPKAADSRHTVEDFPELIEGDRLLAVLAE